jgi:hypothetical protein
VTARGRLGMGVLLATLAAAGSYVGYEKWGPRHTPPGQLALTAIAPDTFEALPAAFNEAADRARIVVLLSPT